MDFRRKNIDLVGKIKLWFSISLALILVGLGSWVLFGLNLGIDFKGGGQFQYRIPYTLRPQSGNEAALLDKTRVALEAQGIKTLPQIAGGDTIVIKTEAKGQSELTSQETRVRRALTTVFTGGKNQDGQPAQLTSLGQQFVGPIIGDELKKNAITGVLLGVALIALWIYIRYNFSGDGTRYAVAAVAALFHDVLVLVGIFALLGHFYPSIEIDGAFIAALLTVVGYSINDSVVIFDRLRENLRLRRKEPFEKVVNDSLLETMSRSINTGLTVLIMLFVLLILGGDSIFNFVLAMLIGIASGLYSSIFNASMVLVAWHRWDEKKAAAARGVRPATAAAPVSSTRSRANAPRAAAASSAAAVSTAPRRSFATTVLPTPTETVADANTNVAEANVAEANTNVADTDVADANIANDSDADLTTDAPDIFVPQNVLPLDETLVDMETASEELEENSGDTEDSSSKTGSQAQRAQLKARAKRRF